MNQFIVDTKIARVAAVAQHQKRNFTKVPKKTIVKTITHLLIACSTILFAGASFGQTSVELPPDHAERMTRGLELFQKDVRGLLTEHCLKCHGGEKTKGDFDLATREDLLKGGGEGLAVVPFDSAESTMMELIRHEEDPHMPSKKPQLPDEDAAKIAAWIDLGAPYDKPLIDGKKPTRDRSVVTEEDRKWWSYQPLAKVTPPANDQNPIDAFLSKAGEAKKLTLNPPAPARALVRRAFLDVKGLPPTMDEVSAFERDPNFPKLVDTILDSPAFGERWARHWLDVARFAESSGFEHDYDRPNAYHYRDFVIKALNSDMPYDKFVRWQLAGDEFAPGDPEALMATGFLGAGVFPTQITANEVERTRYDAMDDMLSTTSSAFIGLTVGCARCHDHKFDAIPTADYYQMLSTFTTTVRSNIDLDLDAEKTKAALKVWAKQGAALKAELINIEKSLQPSFQQSLTAGLGGDPAEWTLLEPSALTGGKKTKFKPLGDGSYLAEGNGEATETYTITAPVSQPRITALRLEALADPSLKQNGPGRAENGNFALCKIEVSIAPPKGVKGEAADVKIARAFADFEQNQSSLSIAAALDGNNNTGWAVDGQIGKDHAAVFVFDKPLDASAGGTLTIKLHFTLNSQHSIGRPRFSLTGVDDPKLEVGDLSILIAAALKQVRLGEKLSPAEEEALFDWWKLKEKTWQEANANLAAHNAKKPNNNTPVLVCAEGYKPLVMHSQGAPFLEQTHILKRGDVNQKTELATQGFLQVLSRGDAKQWQWQPPEGAQYTGRRRSLANWITDVDHGAGALLARVAVNRLWLHHFGRGLVATPNDFGITGAPPSHPELLDWLAGELIRNGWQLKPIHRLIMTSAAYQQSSACDSAKLAADPDNSLFLRRTPQRIEAEAVRDSILAVSGLLDGTMFGRGTLDENSKRRSIYFTIKRSQLMNSMVVFDAPEPLVSQGSRPTTTVAPQALLLMNSPQVRACAQALAQRVVNSHPDDAAAVAADVSLAYQFVLQRLPTADEAKDAAQFLTNGLAAHPQAGKADARLLAVAQLCQVLFGLNEFAYKP